MAIPRASIAKVNSNGDKGHPCHVPRPNCKKSEVHPGNLIQVLG